MQTQALKSVGHAPVQPFVWGEISLSETVAVNGVPYATKRAIGEWLEYGDSRDGINKVLERNPHIDAHSVAVKLTATDGKAYETKVYHPIGFLLIVMESGQPKAHALKQAVAEFVWHFAGPRDLSPQEEMALLRHRRVLALDVSRQRDPFAMRTLLTDLKAVSMRLGLPLPPLKLLGVPADLFDL